MLRKHFRNCHINQPPKNGLKSALRCCTQSKNTTRKLGQILGLRPQHTALVQHGILSAKHTRKVEKKNHPVCLACARDRRTHWKPLTRGSHRQSRRPHQNWQNPRTGRITSFGTNNQVVLARAAEHVLGDHSTSSQSQSELRAGAMAADNCRARGPRPWAAGTGARCSSSRFPSVILLHSLAHTNATEGWRGQKGARPPPRPEAKSSSVWDVGQHPISNLDEF